MTGHVIYVSDQEASYKRVIREFVPDRIVRFDETIWDYADMPEDNDHEVPTPECDPEAENGVNTFFIDVRTGEIIYQCREPDTWFGEDGEPWTGCDGLGLPIAIGYDGAVLCGDAVVDPAGESHDLEDHAGFFVWRARPAGGFWAVKKNDDDRDERWVTASDGSTELDGTYASLPAGNVLVNADVPGYANLDADGALYRWVAPANDTTTRILRFDADFAATEIVYDEGTDPECTMASQVDFLTGP